MLKVYLNELRKVKRQKTVRMIMLVGVLAIVLYLLLSVIIYVFMYRKQEYPVS